MEYKADLHVHYEYSNERLKDSTNRIKDVINICKELGITSIAITDHDILTGHIKFLQEIDDYNKKNSDWPLKPILGNEVYIVDDNKAAEKENAHYPGRIYGHLILLAKNKNGYKQIRELSKIAWTNAFWRGRNITTPIDYNNLKSIVKKGDVICSTACLGSLFAKYIAKLFDAKAENDVEKIKEYGLKINEYLKDYKKIFGNDFYIEIQPNEPGTLQWKYNKLAVSLAEKYNIPYIITTDAHYLRKEDAKEHEIFLKSDKENSDREVSEFYKYTFLMNADEIHSLMDENIGREKVSLALANTLKISDQIELIDMELPTQMPKVDLIENVKLNGFFEKYCGNRWDEFPGIKHFFFSDNLYNKNVLYYIEQGVKNKIISNPNKRDKLERYIKEIDIDLDVLADFENHGSNFSQYFLVTKKIIDLIWEAGSFVGVARGCFTKDALVWTKNGLKNLDKVIIGDEVLSANGEFNKVIDTMSYNIKEPLVQIEYKRQGSSKKWFPNKCTLDHKILVYRNGNVGYVPAKDITISDYVCYPKVKHHGTVSNKKFDLVDYNPGCIYDDNYIYEKVQRPNTYEDSPKTLSRNLGVSESFIDKIIDSPEHYDNLIKENKTKNKGYAPFLVFLNNTKYNSAKEYSDYCKENQFVNRKINRYIELDEDFAMFYGLMLGDGWIREDANSWGLATNASNFKDIKNVDIFNKIAKKLGVEVYKKSAKGEKLNQYICYSKVVVNFLRKEFFISKKGREKIVNPKAYSWSKDLLLKVKEGLLSTDGSINITTNKISFDNTSIPILSLYKYLSNITNDNVQALDVRQIEEDKRNKNWKFRQSYKLRSPIEEREDWEIFNRDYWLLPVQKVNILPEKEETVYDLTVENDPSYTINNMCVHNSAGAFLINYLMDIVDVDAVEANFPYWRFLAKGRRDDPDCFTVLSNGNIRMKEP